ncbi:hypothetical protein MCOR25_010615 [Pyricularia grisea]|nr:hypothetical protein MCOR25_010615 [Pyricularia grisea]
MDMSYSTTTSDGRTCFPGDVAGNHIPRNNVRSFNGWHPSSKRPKGAVPRSSTTSSLNTITYGPQIPQPTNLTWEHNSDDKPTRPYTTASDLSWRNAILDDDNSQQYGTNDDDIRSAELASLQEIVGWQRGEMEAMKRAIEDMQGLLARQRREERDLSWQLHEHRAVSHGRAALVRDWREHARGICVAYRSTIRRQAAEISLLKAEIAKGNGQAKRRDSAPPDEYGGDSHGRLSDA